jgi:hypothetical protein
MHDPALIVSALVVAAALMCMLVAHFRRRKRSEPAIASSMSKRLCGIVVGGDECQVVVEAQYQRNLERIVGGRTESDARHECTAVLRPDQNDSHDRIGVRVEIDEHLVGYLPRATAAEFTRELSERGFQIAVCKATIVGGWAATRKGDAGHFGVVLDACRPFEFDEAAQPTTDRSELTDH